jgi:serpin B
MRAPLLVLLLAAAPALAADPTSTAATAINALGIDLIHSAGQPGANFLVSPYSVQTGLAMTYAGADGATREEMARVLHFPKDDAEVHRSFAALRKSLDELTQQSAERAAQMKDYGANFDHAVLSIANRLYGQAGYAFRAPFLAVVKDNYDAPFEPMDFVKDAAGATQRINGWAQETTRERIRELIPTGVLNGRTRLVLVDAVYLKAPWADEFLQGATRLRPFHLAGGAAADVPTMTHKRSVGYAKRDGFSVIAIPYRDQDLQFLILLPDQVNGLPALEAQLRPRLLAELAQAPYRMGVILLLPKFKLEPPLLALRTELQSLGMRSAFDQPSGSANFERMAPRRADDYLYLAEVFHRAFLEIDERGTEAAAASSAIMATLGMHREDPNIIEVRVDHPFVFAIQHRASGACLFLGRFVDPPVSLAFSHEKESE